MKPKEFVNEDILKQFKDGKEFMTFMGQMNKRGVEKMLEGELDAHLGYEKHDKLKRGTSNYRNGHSDNSVKTSMVRNQRKMQIR